MVPHHYINFEYQQGMTGEGTHYHHIYRNSFNVIYSNSLDLMCRHVSNVIMVT